MRQEMEPGPINRLLCGWIFTSILSKAWPELLACTMSKVLQLYVHACVNGGGEDTLLKMSRRVLWVSTI